MNSNHTNYGNIVHVKGSTPSINVTCSSPQCVSVLNGNICILCVCGHVCKITFDIFSHEYNMSAMYLVTVLASLSGCLSVVCVCVCACARVCLLSHRLHSTATLVT